ncbi:TatD family hydrolase [Methylomonas paludis]|uniref:TatD family hydrolase n=1 Tax=Methylomonas paludis TaxID=1173101 RepID=UPI001FEAE2CC|nr:TatD family hydrolase [Methylomonas paludis]
MTDGSFINLHCHRSAARDKLEIVSWDTLAFGADLLQNGYYSLGIHPWHIEAQDCRQALVTLAAQLQDADLLAIGECGLDSGIQLPLLGQIPVFEQQITLAEQAGKPLIIHCVRAFHELLRIKKQRKADIPWIIHGFTGKPALAVQLLAHGCYISLGSVLLQAPQQARLLLAAIPLQRLFLETDAAAVPISTIYRIAADLLDMDGLILQQLLTANFRRVFFDE